MLNRKLLPVVSSLTSFWTNRYWLKLRFKRYIAIMLALIMLNASAPSATASTLALQAFTRLNDAAGQTWGDIKGWFNSRRSQDSTPRRGVKPREPESNAERESRIASLEVNPGRSVTLQSREPITFAAVPFDSEGTPIHGFVGRRVS